MRTTRSTAALVAAPALALAVPVALAAAPASAATQGGSATVSVLHAVPGLTVDVWAKRFAPAAGFHPRHPHRPAAAARRQLRPGRLPRRGGPGHGAAGDLGERRGGPGGGERHRRGAP